MPGYGFKVEVVIEDDLIDFAVDCYKEIVDVGEWAPTDKQRWKIAKAIAKRAVESLHEEPQDIIDAEDMAKLVDQNI